MYSYSGQAKSNTNCNALTRRPAKPESLDCLFRPEHSPLWWRRNFILGGRLLLVNMALKWLGNCATLQMTKHFSAAGVRTAATLLLSCSSSIVFPRFWFCMPARSRALRYPYYRVFQLNLCVSSLRLSGTSQGPGQSVKLVRHFQLYDPSIHNWRRERNRRDTKYSRSSNEHIMMASVHCKEGAPLLTESGKADGS